MRVDETNPKTKGMKLGERESECFRCDERESVSVSDVMKERV